MKRYLIPIIVIVLVGVGTYLWTSRVSARRAIAKARHAHLDSLRAVQAQRFSAAKMDSEAVQRAGSALHANRADTAPSLRDPWILRNVGAMPDSIRPEDFSEAKVEFDFSEAADPDFIYTGGPNAEGYIDSMTTEYKQLRSQFVSYTVMAMLMRHLVGAPKTEVFSRCPSGYGSVAEYEGLGRPLPPDPDWDTGTVYYEEGCQDTALCDFRFNYPKRIVEMKDINSNHFMSLREYELFKFRDYAADGRSW